MTPARLMLNREIATKLPMVPENTGGTILEKRYKLYQKQLRVYTDRKRRAEPHDLVTGAIVFVANINLAEQLSRVVCGAERIILEK